MQRVLLGFVHTFCHVEVKLMKVMTILNSFVFGKFFKFVVVLKSCPQKNHISELFHFKIEHNMVRKSKHDCRQNVEVLFGNLPPALYSKSLPFGSLAFNEIATSTGWLLERIAIQIPFFFPRKKKENCNSSSMTLTERNLCLNKIWMKTEFIMQSDSSLDQMTFLLSFIHQNFMIRKRGLAWENE